MASAGPYASLHLAPDRQPCQHPTAQFSAGRMPFLPPNQQALKQHQVKTSSDHRSEFPTVSYTTNAPAPPTTITTASVLMAPRPQNDIGPCPPQKASGIMLQSAAVQSQCHVWSHNWVHSLDDCSSPSRAQSQCIIVVTAVVSCNQ